MIEFNLALLNPNNLTDSFFCLDRNDPTIGFPYDAGCISGHDYPLHTAALSTYHQQFESPPDLFLRLCLGSHLAQYLRHQLEEQKGYTSTVGISTNKLLSKLVGNVHKPKGQTTLTPPYVFEP